MNRITDFINDELYPALYQRIDTAFPSMDFRRKGADWHSSHYLNGGETSPRREDKTVVTHRKPTRVLEQGGESLSLVSFYLMSIGRDPNARGQELLEALRYLASICGLELPEMDTEEYRAYKEKEDKLERLAYKMKSALWKEEGAEALNYLQNDRGYSREEIEAMELGYCSREIAEELGDEAPYGAGSTYTLAIPYRSGGRLRGFKLRALSPEVKPKYKNTVGLPKRASFFGLTGLKLTGDGLKDRDLSIVEGELDALRAQTKGVENIVACAGLDISTEAVQEAKSRGVRRITLIVDYEKTEAERTAKQPKIEKAIRTISQSGLLAMVSELPEDEEGNKVDVDSFLSTHSREDLQSVIDEAQTAAAYIYTTILSKYTDRELTDKEFDNLREETIALLNDSVVVSPIDKDRILRSFELQFAPNKITREALQAEADSRKREADAARQKRLTNDLLASAQRLASSGEVEESLRLLSENVGKISQVSREVEYSSLLSTPTADTIRAKLRNRPEGVRTGYYFSKGTNKEQLVLPAAAFTIIAAPTSHGKSTFLRNLALQTAQGEEEGSVLYFSFEEDLESTIIEFVNTYVGEDLTTPSKNYNNLTTISEYYRDGSTKYIKAAVCDEFKRKEKEFIQNYIETGKLRIYDSDFGSTQLIEAIKFVSRSIRIKAVFIDYVQLLYKEGNKLQRREELKEIAKDIRQLAKDLKLPIVLAAQLSREAKSPTDMVSQNLADSADLEREANKVILLWNSVFDTLKDGTYDANKIESSKRPTLGKSGQIYAKLSKNRGGAPNLDVLLNFDGNTGRIATQEETEENKLLF